MNNIKNTLKREFTIVPNGLINDRSLTPQARFLFVFMACRPDDWEFYQEPLSEEIGWSIDTLRKYLKNLLDSGWISREKKTRVKGMFQTYNYVLHAMPQPSRKNTDMVKNRVGKSPTLYKKDTPKQKSNTPSIGEIEFKVDENLPVEEQAIERAILKAKRFFEDYPAMEIRLRSQAKIWPTDETFDFGEELRKWVRYNADNLGLMTDPAKYISSSFGRWLMNYNQFKPKTKHAKDESGKNSEHLITSESAREVLADLIEEDEGDDWGG